VFLTFFKNIWYDLFLKLDISSRIRRPLNGASWTNRQVGVLIQVYGDAVFSSTYEGSIKAQEWKKVEENFNRQVALLALPADRVRYSKQQLQSKVAELKSKFMLFNFLKSKSGFGFNPFTQMIEAEADVWDRLIAENPKAAQFRHNTLRFHNELYDIFINRTATSEWATSTGRVL
jgi:hypothetical protein